MLETKIIVVDGLSGSGKSTACQWLELQLRRNGYGARWLWEGDIDHPLHWWTFWDGRDYLPPDFAGITTSRFIETSLVNWQRFVAEAQAGETIYVAESVLLLMAVGQLLQGDPPPAQLLAYGQQVQALIRPLNPILIYFRQTDIASRFRKVWDFRGQAVENELIAKFVGRYKSGEAQVELKKGRLLLHLPGAPGASLTPITSHSFYVGVTPPVAITFVEDSEGAVREMRLDSTRLGGGKLQVWRKE